MLFRPPAEHRLDAARHLLDDWNSEADRFREAARAAQGGEAPSSALLDAAGEARLGLRLLIDDIDGALERVAPGAPEFTGLLQTQLRALALSESIGRSCRLLETA